MTELIRTDSLFSSSPAMASATNYTDWTFSLFERFIRGDVLEVGCGVGTFTRLLVRAPGVRRVLSIDTALEAVKHCRARVSHAALEVREADVVTIDGAFDLIVCMNVLEHIEDDRRALRHMLGLLRPAGTLFLLVPAHDLLYSSFDRESGHFRRYSKARMQTLLAGVADGSTSIVRQFYFNSIGAVGYFAVYRLLRKPPRADARGEIGWFDRYIVPVQRRFERNRSPFGISLVTVLTKA